MRFTWRGEWPHLAILITMFVLAGLSWSGAPERIPTHWGLDGHPDAYGGRFAGLLLMPLIAVGLYALLRVLPRLDPGRAHYDSFAGAYGTIRLGTLAILAVVHGATLMWARGYAVSLEACLPLAIGALLIVVGNIFGKIRPNGFVGFRTPWTLSSKVAWSRTHRAAGWLLMSVGVLAMVAGSTQARWLLYAAIGLLGSGVLALVVYSYRLWRDDPDKTPPAGTLPARD